MCESKSCLRISFQVLILLLQKRKCSSGVRAQKAVSETSPPKKCTSRNSSGIHKVIKAALSIPVSYTEMILVFFLIAFSPPCLKKKGVVELHPGASAGLWTVISISCIIQWADYEWISIDPSPWKAEKSCSSVRMPHGPSWPSWLQREM